MKQQMGRKMNLKAIIPWLAVSLTACTSAYPPRDTSTLNKINDQLKQAAAPRDRAAAPLPGAVSSSLLPPLRMPMPRASSKQLEQRFDLVVSEAPVNQVLMGIVSGTGYSIMVKPKSAVASAPGAAPSVVILTDKVTVNLKDVTVFEALDAIREVYGYDYTVEGKRIYVQPPELQTQLYQVNYIIGQRRGVSDMQVIGGATVGSSSGSSSGGTSSSSSGSGSSSGSFSSVQASALSTIAKSDIWGEIEDALRTTLGCQIPKKQAERASGSGSGGSGGGGSSGGGGGSSSSSSSSGSSGPSRADVSFQGDTQSGERQRGVDGCADGRAMSISQMSGTIMVRGMPSEQRMIGKMLRSMQLNIERQVIIEAKIIDVELNSGSQQGINWADFNHGLHRASIGSNTNGITELGGGGGIVGSVGGVKTIQNTSSSGTDTNTTATFTPTTLGGLLGTSILGNAGGAFSAGLGLALQFQNFSAMVNFLQTQGQVHVLSSPRIATLNSQKAVIKVGTEEPFVSSITPQTNTATAANILSTSATLNYQPFFAGISLDVTPKIDDQGNVTLHVHAMVNSIVEKSKIATPDANSVLVPFAVNTISETDSVVKTKDGQVIVIGGLMTESVEDNRQKMPGAGDVPGVGALFSKGGQKATKRELVILLKPTVVIDDSAWTNDIAAVQARVEGLSGGTNPSH